MALKLVFDPDLDYQKKAINTVINLFKGQNEIKTEFYDIISNNSILSITENEILENLNNVQLENNLEKSKEIKSISKDNFSPDFSIEMETGTGKTYVYLRTIFELNKKYNFKKFVIIVPSVAIREGLINVINKTRVHFNNLYSRVPFQKIEYNSSKITQLKNFAESNSIQILIMTIDSFNKEKNKINNYQDNLTEKPLDYIKKTNPIVILDEAQNFESEISMNAINELNPLFKLRYSATHKNQYNLIYRLTPKNAYDSDLVKRAEVFSIYNDEDENSAYIKVEELSYKNKKPYAKVKVFKNEKSGLKLKIIVLNKIGDSLFKKTNNSIYKNYILDDIKTDFETDELILEFSNGIKLQENEETLDQDEVKELQVKFTVLEHFKKKLELNPKGIKVLSLFFIDKVSSYVDNGKVKVWFEKYYAKYLEKYKEKFEKLNINIYSKEEVQGSYFSTYKDNTRDSSILNDKKMFDKIMRQKEELLNLNEPIEFIFSHSALKEGWDNPNVFNICTLNFTNSQIKKRQEIGRGLRIPVNQKGKRIFDSNVNILTVFTNESYKEFVENLQSEYDDEKQNFVKPENKRKQIEVKLNDNFKTKSFKYLWDKINHKGEYIIKLNIEKFIENISIKLNAEFGDIFIKKNKGIKIEKVNLKFDINNKIEVDNYNEDNIIISKNYLISNFIKQIQIETKLTKKTIIKILNNFNFLERIFDNPQVFLIKFINIMKNELSKEKINNLNYFSINSKFNLDIFKDKIKSYENKTLKVKNSIYDNIIIDTDSLKDSSEKLFAEKIDLNPRVSLFLKLPDEFKIETPKGTYNPDWAILIKNKENKEELFFIIETKIGVDKENIRPFEKIKINCAKKFYKMLSIDLNLNLNFKDIYKLEDFDNFLESKL